MNYVLPLLAATLMAGVRIAHFDLKSDGHRVCRKEGVNEICFPTADSVALSQYDIPLGNSIDLYKMIANYEAWLAVFGVSGTDMNSLEKAVVKGAVFIPADQIHQLMSRFTKLELSNFAVNGNDALTDTSKKVQIVGTLSWRDCNSQTGSLNFDGHVVISKLDRINELTPKISAQKAQAVFASLIEINLISGTTAALELLKKDLAQPETPALLAAKLLRQVVAPIVAGTLYLQKAGELDPTPDEAPTSQESKGTPL